MAMTSKIKTSTGCFYWWWLLVLIFLGHILFKSISDAVAVAGVPVLGTFENQTPQRIHRLLVGHSVRLDCYPNGSSITTGSQLDTKDVFIVQWKKQGIPSPVFLWRRDKSPREGRTYEGRVTLVSPTWSLDIVDIRLTDDGLYDCQVWDVNGRPYVNGTLVAVRVDDTIPRFVDGGQPRDLIVAAIGGQAEFACRVRPSPHEINWFFNGLPFSVQLWSYVKVINDGQIIRIGTEGSNPEVRRLQVGRYSCLARFESFQLYSNSANLTLAEISNYDDQETINLSASLGGYAVISGSVPHSLPPAIVTVTHNGTALPLTSARTILMPSSNLHIKDVRFSDAGVYRFSAVNPITGERIVAKNIVRLQVIVSDRNYSAQLLAAQKKFNDAVVGSNVSLECAATGNPLPRITWTKYGGLLPEGRYSQILGNLFLYGLRPNDTGTYICEVENVVELPVSTIVALEVLEEPEIHRWTEKYEVREREDLVLDCHARGNPKPIVKWMFNGSTIFSTDMVVIRESKLNIHYCQREHAGLYQCFASNTVGMTQRACLVRVIPFLAIDGGYSPSSSRGHRREQSLSLNSTLTFIKDDNNNDDVGDDDDDGDDEFHQSDDYPIRNSDSKDKLDIDFDGSPDQEEEEDEGEGSKRNNRRRNKKKSKKKKNGSNDDDLVAIPPTRPEVTKLTDESVMVRWDVPPNTGLAILFFKVQYKDVTKRSSGRWMTVDEDIAPHVHSYEVLNLRTGRAYRFRIAAVYSNKDNKLGPNSVRFVLLKDPPMKKPEVGPTIVHIEPISPSAISLRWQYLDVDGVIVDGFYIYYRETTKAGDYIKITVLGSNTLTSIISHLLPETAYDIKMQSFNTAGTSDFSNIHTKKTLESMESGQRPDDDGDDDYMTRPTPVSNTASSDRLLYTVLGSLLALLTLALVSFVCYCSWKQRRRRRKRTEIRATNASKVIENGREVVGKYGVVNGRSGTGTGIGRDGGGMFLWDKMTNIENGHGHRYCLNRRQEQETSLSEIPRLSRNNNKDNDDHEENEVIREENEVIRESNRAPIAVCQPLIHRGDGDCDVRPSSDSDGESEGNFDDDGVDSTSVRH